MQEKEVVAEKPKDLIELIYINNDNELIYEIFKTSETLSAAKRLSEFCADFRFDYHGVLDVIPSSYIDLPPNSCVISFVGSNMRKHSRSAVGERVLSGQIDFGILNFVRGYDENDKDNFIISGSKAWVNKHLGYTRNNTKKYYIDDGLDHIKSTKYMLRNIEPSDRKYSRLKQQLICIYLNLRGKKSAFAKKSKFVKLLNDLMGTHQIY